MKLIFIISSYITNFFIIIVLIVIVSIIQSFEQQTIPGRNENLGEDGMTIESCYDYIDNNDNGFVDLNDPKCFGLEHQEIEQDPDEEFILIY